MVKVDRKSRGWGEPINLGSFVNTPGDELYPFLHDDGYLYFASSGLPGMGGFDLFRVELGCRRNADRDSRKPQGSHQ